MQVLLSYFLNFPYVFNPERNVPDVRCPFFTYALTAASLCGHRSARAGHCGPTLDLGPSPGTKPGAGHCAVQLQHDRINQETITLPCANVRLCTLEKSHLRISATG